MKKIKNNDAQVYSISRSGASLKITLPKTYCDRLGLEPGQRLAVRSIGDNCLLVGSIDDIYNPAGVIMNFGKGVKDDS